MEKLFDEINNALILEPDIKNYFANYFYIKEPDNPPTPFILFLIDNISNLNNSSSIYEALEFDLRLKIISDDYEFDELYIILNKILVILNSFLYIDDKYQITLKLNKTEIINKDDILVKKNNRYFNINIFLKAYFFQKL